MDVVAVQSVLEVGGCSDEARARAVLDEALLSARAPARAPAPSASPASPASLPTAPSWWLTVEIGGGRSLRSATAILADDAGNVVARRVVENRATTRGTAGECTSLMRAVGAWTALVLDAEVARDEEAAARAEAAEAEAAEASAAEGVAAPSPASSGSDVLGPLRPARSLEESWTYAIGAQMYLHDGMTGYSSFDPVFTGLALSGSVVIGRGWHVRPSFAFGFSTSTPPADAPVDALNHVGFRTDLCHAVVLSEALLFLDLCAGAEVNAVFGVRSATSSAGAGPASSLRFAVGRGVSIDARGLVGLNFTGDSSSSRFLGGALGVSLGFR